jgi:hypothetical protein
MVSSVSGSSSAQALYQAQSSASSKLTDDQKTSLENILSNYDVESMTDEEKKTMMDEMKSAGIPMTSETKDIMDAAGFTPPEKPQGPPPEEASSSSEEVPEYLKEFMEKQASGEVTQDDIDALVQKLQASGETVSGTLVDTKA